MRSTTMALSWVARPRRLPLAKRGDDILGGNMWPQDINDRGQVVGQQYVASRGTWEAFLWADGVVTELGTLGGYYGGAYGINDRGEIVGTSGTASGSQHAVLWQDGVITDLGVGSSSSAARAINNRGQVVGQSTGSGMEHPFLWQDGVMTNLGTLGGNYGSAIGINDHGQVAGLSATAAGAGHPFLWEDGAMADLTSGQSPGINWGAAYDVNKRGQVVGQILMSSGFHAAVWQDGVMTELGPLGGSYSTAVDINDRGQAVGRSYTNYEHAVLFSQK